MSGSNSSINEDYKVISLEDTARAAASIAAKLPWPACVYLCGDLGAGKTSLCQGIIAALGNATPVTSPTYNLIQEYPVDTGTVYHMDLYRVNDPSELEFLALGDLWQADALFLVEWPDRGHGYLPDATHIIDIGLDEQKNDAQRFIRFQQNP